MSFFPTEKTKVEKESIYFNIYNLKTKIWHIFIKRKKCVTTEDSTKVEKRLAIEIYKRIRFQMLRKC